MMSRYKALKLSMVTSLLHEAIVFVVGLILPKLMLVYYGSTGNGLVSSISQFLGFSTILHAGLGGVTRAALFKPLAENDFASVSSIMKATEKFMQKVALILGAAILLLAVLYPFAVIDEYDYVYSCLMVLILGVSCFANSLFGIKNQILLQADQKHYIYNFSVILSQLLSFGVSAFLICLRRDLIIVKLGAALAVLIKPFFLEFYVRRHYKLDKTALPDDSAINQRWHAFAQQVAVIVNEKIDITLITVFSALSEVSVYTVHYMVVNNISSVVSSSITGIGATFGSMLANGEKKNLQKSFKMIEWGMFAFGAFIFAVVAVMLTSFVDIYTSGAKDAGIVNYHRPFFGFAMTVTALLNCYRKPYQFVVEAAGHFKQTRNGAILETVVNLVVSIVLLIRFGIIGVIIGTFVACIIRTMQYSVYASKNILDISFLHIIKNYIVYLGAFGACCAAFIFLPILPAITTYREWVLSAIPVTLICFAFVMILSLIFNYTDVKNFFLKLVSNVKKKSEKQAMK